MKRLTVAVVVLMVVFTTIALSVPAAAGAKPKPPRHKKHQTRGIKEVTPPGWNHVRLPRHFADV
jgi:Spy/CpxP family protein refolding chaperone